MRWITILLINTWILLGVTWDYVQTTGIFRERERTALAHVAFYREKTIHLEEMLETCLKHGTWNLQGYYFRCEAVYMGVSEYDVYLGE